MSKQHQEYVNQAFEHQPSISGQDCDISIVWRNLCYEVRVFFGSQKLILRQLNGCLKFHSLNGFLGPSGAGKTTLLNCLNGTLNKGMHPNTEIYLNRSLGKWPVIRSVQQHVHETIVANMTIRQVLYYAFRFKNSRRQLAQMDGHIRSVLDQLLLDQSILDRPFEKCSGGEQRRIAIAQELMSLDKPSFLFIDEPTTGLDSNAAFLVMKCLRNLADNHKLTILVSIHTPNSDIVALFDKLYILAKGGVCIYSDVPGRLRENLQEKLNFTFDENRPPIEMYMKIACNGISDEQVRLLADSTMVQERQQSDRCVEKMNFMSQGIYVSRKGFSIGDLLLQLRRIFVIVFIVEYKKLLAQLFFFAIIYLYLSTTFDNEIVQSNTCYSFDPDFNFDLGNHTCKDKLNAESKAQEYTIYQLFGMMYCGITMMCISAIMFIPMLKIFHNEHRNRKWNGDPEQVNHCSFPVFPFSSFPCTEWYSMSVFYWSFVAIRFVEISLISIYVTILFYFGIDHMYLDQYRLNWLRFGHFLFFIWLECVYVQSWGQLFSLIFLDNLVMAVVGSQLTFVFLTVCNGYWFNVKHINKTMLIWATEILANKLVSNGLMYSAFGMDRCDPEKEVSFVLVDFDVNVNTVYSDLWRLVLNIILLRLTGIILMAVRFSANLSRRKFSPSADCQQPLSGDFGETNKKNPSLEIETKKIERIKNEKELLFEEFSRHKIIIAWRSLTLFASGSIYEINSAQKVTDSKKILRNLNGQFRFGTLNALMGTSGAGKTSLLKVLNGRSKTRLSEESIFYLSKYTPIRICYLTQEVSGHLMPGLTAKQSLIYASKLKNAFEDTTVIDHEQKALIILKELDVADTADTNVERCSGGQRKRLALALELTSLRMPNLVCIDEPTSGLDSNSAEVMMVCLRRLAHKHNITIITSIHQPSYEVLMMFDQVYALARGGVCIYSGPPDAIHQSLSKIQHPQDMQNIFPVEELMKYSCLNYQEPVIQKLVEYTEEKILDGSLNLEEETNLAIDGIPVNRNRFSMKSVWSLIIRYLSYIRGYLWIQVLFFWFLYLAFGLVMIYFFDEKIALRTGCVSFDEGFNNTCNQTEDEENEKFDLINNLHYTYFFTCLFLFLLLIQNSLTFSQELVYFLNEHRNGWYSTGSFYLMKSVMEMVPILPPLFIYIYMVNIFESFRPGMYFWLLFLLIISIIASQGMAHLLAIITRGDPTLISSIIPGIFLFFFLISNIGTPIRRMHYVYQSLSNLSLYRFAIEAMLLLQYGFGRCMPKQIQKTLYRLQLNEEEYFSSYLFNAIVMLIFNCFVYRCLSLFLLLAKTNRFQNRRRRAEKILAAHESLKPPQVIIPGLNCHHEFTIKKINF